MIKAILSKIRSINTHLDPFRYYGLRLLRVFLFYHAFIIAAEMSVMNLPFGDSSYVSEYNPFRHHFAGTFSLYVVFIMVAGIFILYDSTARRRFCKTPPEETHYFSEHLGILRSYEFICHAVSLFIFPLIFKTTAFDHPVKLLFGNKEFTELGIYLRYLLVVYPALLIIEMILRLRTRTYWRDLDFEDAMDKHFDLVKIFFLWILIAFVYGYLAQFYLPAIPIILSFFAYPVTWIILFSVILAITLFRRIRALKIRKKFLKKLIGFCKDSRFELSKIKHPYRSVFFDDSSYHFTVKAYGKTYACKMIAAVSKDAKMVFVDEKMGYFKSELKVKNSEMTIFRKKFQHGFDAPEADHKVLIISPTPNTILAVNTKVAFSSKNVTYVKESKEFTYVANSSNVFGSTVFSGSAFLNALDRNCLYVKPDLGDL